VFTGELTSFQLDPAEKMCRWKLCLVGLPMGMGKTVVAIAAAEKLFELDLIKNVVVIAPPSICFQWKERILEFTDHNDVVLVTRKENRDYAFKAKYTIIPYSLFRRDSKAILKKRASVVIADEAQEFSNFRSKTYQIIAHLRSNYRWALTGTAISNKLEELYAIMQWVDPYCLPKWPVFDRLHLVRNPHTKIVISYRNLEDLHGYLKAKRMVCKSVEEIQDQLPELLRHVHKVEKDQDVIAAEKALLEALQSMAGNNYQHDPAVTSALLEARQAVVGKTKLNYAADLVAKILAEDSANRVVIFCFNKEPLRRLRELIGSGVFFTGDESPEQKAAAIAEFRSGTGRVLLCSNAGSTGLDLPFANYVVHLDVPFSHGIMDQRSTRIQRTSSKFKAVVAYFLVVDRSIEEYYYQVTLNKGKLARAAQEGGTDKVVIKPQSLKSYLEETYG